MNHLILASGSPRRRELLSLYTTDFTVCVSDFDESAVTAPTPAQLVEQLAIDVDECIYGLGERYTPFVKNGQMVRLQTQLL